MTEYAYGRIRKLAQSLDAHEISQPIQDEILSGGAAITSSTSPKRKAAWLQAAMERMDALLDEPTRRSVREACACCLGGKRLKLSKAIYRDHETLAQRLAACNETPFVFGHSVTQQADGRVMVQFMADGQAPYRCACLGKGASGPFSPTYCMCCGATSSTTCRLRWARHCIVRC